MCAFIEQMLKDLKQLRHIKPQIRRDLISDLKSELHGKSEEAMIALFTEPFEYDADELRKAMKGIRTNRDTLIEIIALRPNPKSQEFFTY